MTYKIPIDCSSPDTIHDSMDVQYNKDCPETDCIKCMYRSGREEGLCILASKDSNIVQQLTWLIANRHLWEEEK